MAIRESWTSVIMFITLHCLLLLIQVTDQNSDNNVYTVLHAVDKLLQYYESEYMNMNADGTYGLRVIEGQSSSLLEDYDNGLLQDVHLTVIEKLQKIQNKSKTIADKSLPYIEKKDVKYYKHLTPLIALPWNVFLPHRQLTGVYVSSLPIEQRTQDLNEVASDECISKLLGTDEIDPACTVTPECWTMMTKPYQKMYSLTHQVLYFSIGYQMKCTKSFEIIAKMKGMGSVRQIQDTMCAAILQEVRETARMGFPSNMEDLFMEQVFIGASLGYVEFVEPDWLDKILSWQFPNGCYGDKQKKEDVVNLFEELDMVNSENKEEKSNVVIEEEVEYIQQRNLKNADVIIEPFYSRKLQRVQKLHDGCEAHKTAVAAGAVVVHLRYFINPGPPGLQAFLDQSLRMYQHETDIGEYDGRSTDTNSLTTYFVILCVFFVVGLLIRQFLMNRKITLRQSYFMTA